MKDEDIEIKLIELGLSPELKGFPLIKDLIIIISKCIKSGDRQSFKLEWAYQILANKNNTSTVAVARNIRSILKKSKNYRGMNLMKAVFLIEAQIRGIA